MPLIELSHGELVDRQTILEIKKERAPGVAAVAAALAHVRDALAGTDLLGVETHVAELRRINLRLWDLEDEVRGMLAAGHVGVEYARTAAEIPALNDLRAAAKRAIDRALGHAAHEVKVHRA
jgi:hypothetical protein